MIRSEPNETIKLTNCMCQTIAGSGQGCTTNTLKRFRPRNEKLFGCGLE